MSEKYFITVKDYYGLETVVEVSWEIQVTDAMTACWHGQEWKGGLSPFLQVNKITSKARATIRESVTLCRQRRKRHDGRRRELRAFPFPQGKRGGL